MYLAELAGKAAVEVLTEVPNFKQLTPLAQAMTFSKVFASIGVRH